MDRTWEWLGVDHVTYAVWDIEFYKNVYVERFGGTVVHHTADADPEGTSSMVLYGIQLGASRLAFVSPINRIELSQIEKFLRKHGDHAIQHVAYGIKNLESFVADAQKWGFRFLGPIIKRSDPFGPVKQIFAKRFDALYTDPAEGVFFEFVERPGEGQTSEEAFSAEAARELYRRVEGARETVDPESFIDHPKK